MELISFAGNTIDSLKKEGILLIILPKGLHPQFSVLFQAHKLLIRGQSQSGHI